MPELQGTNSSDLLTGTNQGDVIHGNHGDDTIHGLDGNDVIYGGGSLQQLDTNGIVATNATTAHIELESIAQGNHNGVGMYKVSSDGAIHSVEILYAPDGGKGGGQAVYPHTAIDVKLAAGEQLGFFVLGNGYGKGNVAGLLNDPQANWEMRTESGDPGLIVDTNLELWHVDSVTGEATKLVKGQGHEIMHSIGTAEGGYAPNPDGVPHAVAIVDTATGTVRLGLEAQKNGGNLGFDDAIIIIELGANNVEGLDDALIPLTGTDHDLIYAGDGDDTVYGQEGNDRIFGEQGNDRLFGGNGDDRISGGGGNDFIAGNAGNDELLGDEGDDVIEGGDGEDTITGGEGEDAIKGGDGEDNISGGSEADELSGGKGTDDVSGDDGNDVIKGDSGDDTISGGAGEDAIKGGTDNDDVHGGDGDDDLSGGKGADVIYGDAGNDTIFGDTGNDVVDGGEGDDVVKGGEDDDEVYGGAGNDTITGGKGHDVLDGGEGNDSVHADSGDDVITASAGDDYYNGGSGIDLLDYSAAPAGVDVNLHGHTVTSSLGSHEVWSVENVTGSAHDDVLAGDKRENSLSGGDGDDWLRGGEGNDALAGGDGADTYSWSRKDVTGKNGDDNYVDTISGFDANDILDLSALIELATGQQTSDVVQLSETGGDTTVAAFNAASSVWVDVAVLDDVIGLSVESLDAGGQLIV